MTRPILTRPSGLVAALALVMSCSDSAAPRVPECTGNVTLIVVPETRPAVGWGAPCGITELQIKRTSDDMMFWRIRAGTDKPMPSPITYGVLPEGAAQLTVARLLLEGVEYQAIVFRGPADAPVEIGSQVFTP